MMSPDLNELLEREIQWTPYTGQTLSKGNSIHVIKAKVDINLPSIIQNHCLSGDEIERSTRFYHKKDKENYILRRHILRKVISDFTNTPANNIEFGSTANKKPTISGVHFNTSHSENAVVIIMSASPVGIDIEFMNVNFDYQDMLEVCLNSAEINFVLNGTNPLLNFYILWTRKEAYLKTTGQGITDHLQEVPSLIKTLDINCELYASKTYLDSDNFIISMLTTLTNTEHYNFWEYIE